MQQYNNCIYQLNTKGGYLFSWSTFIYLWELTDQQQKCILYCCGCYYWRCLLRTVTGRLSGYRSQTFCLTLSFHVGLPPGRPSTPSTLSGAPQEASGVLAGCRRTCASVWTRLRRNSLTRRRRRCWRLCMRPGWPVWGQTPWPMTRSASSDLWITFVLLTQVKHTHSITV